MILLILSFFFSFFSPANTTANDLQKAYNIRFKMNRGQVVRHGVNIKTVVPGRAGSKPMTVTADMVVAQKCTDVKPNRFTIQSSIEKMNMNVPGVDPKVFKPQIDAALSQRATVVMDGQGKIVSISGQQSSGFNNPTSYPPGPIKIGQTWKSTVDQPSQMGQMKMTVTNKLLGIENVRGQSCYKISLVMSGSGAVAVTGSGTIWIRASDGLPEKGAFTNTMKMGQQGGASFNVSTTMTSL